MYQQSLLLLWKLDYAILFVTDKDYINKFYFIPDWQVYQKVWKQSSAQTTKWINYQEMSQELSFQIFG